MQHDEHKNNFKEVKEHELRRSIRIALIKKAKRQKRVKRLKKAFINFNNKAAIFAFIASFIMLTHSNDDNKYIMFLLHTINSFLIFKLLF